MLLQILVLAFCLSCTVNGQIFPGFANGYQNGMSASLLLPDRPCESSNGVVGVCLTKVGCRGRGGREVGSCSGLFKICCQETRTCNDEMRRNNSYFVHPSNQPSQAMQCPLRVHKLPGVCQLKLDFVQFSLRGPDPVTTKCDRDRFVVSGHDYNSIVPGLCGENQGQHVYVDVASVKGPIQLLTTTSELESEVTMNRQWSIRIIQIPCSSTMKAPQGCLQYYTGSSGRNIRSFNYGNARSDEDSYPGGLDYTICIRKELGLCRATFESVGKFGMNAAETEPNQSGIACDNDYILIGETRYCGGGGLPKQPQNPGANEDVPRSRGTGPLWLDVVTGSKDRTPPDTSRPGFNLRYQQESCQIK